MQLHFILVVVIICVVCVVAPAASVPAPPPMPPLSDALQAAKPVSLMPEKPAEAMIFTNHAASTPPASAEWVPQAGGTPVLRVETFNHPKHADWVDIKYMIREPIKKGDVLLMRVQSRAEYAKQESGEAMFEAQLLQRKPEWAPHLQMPLTAGPDWALVELPFLATRDAETSEGEIHLSCGTIPQAVQFGKVEVWNFGNRVKLSDLPQTRFTYKGREENAAWRDAALTRIEQIRTAPIDVRVIDAAGAPIPDATIQVRLVRPAFIWGTEVDSAFIVSQTPEAQKYREMIVELFDTVVIGNGMKWPKWSGSAASRAQAMEATDWIESQKLRMRGHCLVWPGDKFSPKRVQTMPAPRAELPLLIKERIRDIMTETKGRIIGWDVINEMLHERDYFKYMPETEAAEWFKVARETDPNAKLFINEYAMLNSRKSPEKIADYLALVQRLRDAGAPIDAMGIQGHIGRQVRAPEDVLNDLDLLAKAGLELQITEFDINMTDEELQADYTRDFLIALYSHPLVTGFTMWGFWQPKHWKPDAAMYRADWSEKPNAKVWRDLVRGEWLTNVTGKTSIDGRFATRGHLGDYEFTVIVGDKPAKQMRTLTKSGATVTIQVP